MLCDECGKREATVHIMQIGPDGRMERNLCEHCAGGIEKWLGEPLEEKKDMSAGEFLQNVFRGTQAAKTVAEETVLSCPSCGMDYEEFQKNGMLGCPRCYQVFCRQLEPILRRVHGLSMHNGKVPPDRQSDTLRRQHEMLKLREKLQQAVEREAYEDAAKYRDLLRDLERGEGEAGHGE